MRGSWSDIAMGRTDTAVVALASLALVASVASASSAGARYQDPRGDYTRPPKRIVHPDIISLQVVNTLRSVAFDIDFARAPSELLRVDILLDSDVHRALGLGSGRFRQADLTFVGNVFDAYQARKRQRVWGFVSSVPDPVPVGWIRASAKRVHVTLASRFTIRDKGGRKRTVVIPGRFRFFVWAWGDPSMNVDQDLPDEDFAPNSGWSIYRMG
jgi:hypothetical protein